VSGQYPFRNVLVAVFNPEFHSVKITNVLTRCNLKNSGEKLKLADRLTGVDAVLENISEVIEGKRTVLQYLLSPVQRVESEAGLER
jgi:hypothetical protein